MTRPLRVFLCHASQDKPAVRELYKRLAAETWIEPWLDEESLLPGQDFDVEIYKATRDADAIIICLSKISVAKEGYVNKEIRRALDIADEKPEGAIYVIPLRLDDCKPSFERLKQLHWVDYFTPNAHEKLLKSLRARAAVLKIEITENKVKVVSKPKAKSKSSPRSKKKKPITRIGPSFSTDFSDADLDLYRFIQIPSTETVPYSFYIGKYPVTNAQYERYINSLDYANPVYWVEFPKFDENCKRTGNWGTKGLEWIRGKLLRENSKAFLPRYWNRKDFGKSHPNNPVVGISWYEASAYCEWLLQNWHSLLESESNPSIKPDVIRLPLEIEWVAAAGGDKPKDRYPWDKAGQVTTSLKDILRRSNIIDSGIRHTTPVNAYPLGESPFGVVDMAGNVWEWQANFSNPKQGVLSLCRGSWTVSGNVPVSGRLSFYPDGESHFSGFRVVIIFHE